MEKLKPKLFSVMKTYTKEQFEKDEELYKEVMEDGLFFNQLGIMEDR